MGKENQEWSSFKPTLIPNQDGMIYCMKENDVARLQITTINNGVTIIEYCFTNPEGNINLMFSPDGIPTMMTVAEDGHNPYNCSIYFDVETARFNVMKSEELDYDNNHSLGVRVLDKNKSLRLGVLMESECTLLLSSDSWVNQAVRVDLRQMNWERLLSLSPARWQDQRGQEKMLKVLDGIIKERLTEV